MTSALTASNEVDPSGRARGGASSGEAVRDLVVVVEDDEPMRLAVDRMLRIAGRATIAFDSAEAMLASRVASSARCLVVDIGLPGMSGLDLVEQLRRRGDGVSIVIVTALDEPSVRERAARLGVRSVLIKPFRARDLVDAVGGRGSEPPSTVQR